MPKSVRLARKRQLRAARQALSEKQLAAKQALGEEQEKLLSENSEKIDSPGPSLPIVPNDSPDIALQSSLLSAVPVEENPLPATGRKLRMTRKRLGSSGTAPQQKWVLMHLDQLTEIVQDLFCPNCLQDSVYATVLAEGKQGFSSQIQLLCKHCSYENTFMSSIREKDTHRRHPGFEVNRLMSLFNLQVGEELQAQKKFGSAFGLPELTKKVLTNQEKRFTEIPLEEDAASSEQA